MKISNLIEKVKEEVREELVETLESEGYSLSDKVDGFVKIILKEIIAFNKTMVNISNTEILEIMGGKR